MDTSITSRLFLNSIPVSSTSSFALSKIAISSFELRSATFILLLYADAISGTRTVTSPMILLTQASLHPRAYSSSLICKVFLLSSSPSFNCTRHLPQEAFPEHGASMATLESLAISSKLSPALAYVSTTLPSSNANVILNISNHLSRKKGLRPKPQPMLFLYIDLRTINYSSR